MTTVLATAVAIGFAWSVMLFFAAVFIRERHQESGFGWALAGAGLFLVTFCDRLPGHGRSLRTPLELLPGVTDDRQLFASSVAALIVLLVFYAFRIAVFYQLFLKDADFESGGTDDVINDYVAPALSYLSFGICLVALVGPLYELDLVATVTLAIVLILAYYGRLLIRAWELLSNLATVAVIVRTRTRLVLARMVLSVVLFIARAENLRTGGDPGRLSTWAAERRASLAEEERLATAAEKERKQKIAADLAPRPRRFRRITR